MPSDPTIEGVKAIAAQAEKIVDTIGAVILGGQKNKAQAQADRAQAAESSRVYHDQRMARAYDSRRPEKSYSLAIALGIVGLIVVVALIARK